MIEGLVYLVAVMGLLVALSESSRRRGETRRADTLFTLLDRVRGDANAEVEAYRKILAEERKRNEHLSRLLDQYRAEGIQEPSYQTYGPPTPVELKPLPLEAERWLDGLESDVRPEFEALIRDRLAETDDVGRVLAELSTVH